LESGFSRERTTLVKGLEMDWKSEISRALGFAGGLHFATEFLVERWRKNNGLPPGTVPISTADTDGADGANGGGNGVPAGFAYTLYSLDSDLGADAALSVAAALLSPSSGAGGTSMPSTPALAGASGGAAAPLAAGLAGYIVGKTLA
jgi:hypothetical protein